MPVIGQTAYPTPPATSGGEDTKLTGFATAGIIGIDSLGASVVFVSFTTQAGSIV